MNKFAVIALGLVGLASLSSAGTCTSPVTNTGFLQVGGTTIYNGNVSCTATVGSGQYITDVVIHALGDVANPSAGSTLTWSFGNLSITPTGTLVGITTNQMSPSSIALTPFSGQQVSTGGISGNSGTDVTQVLIQFSVTATLTGSGSVNSASLDLNQLIGASAATGSGCTSTIAGACSGGAYVSGVFWNYATARNPPEGVPEPATLGLMGFALVGLGLLPRRFKQS